MIATMTRTSQDEKKEAIQPPTSSSSNKAALYQTPVSLGFLIVSLVIGVGVSFILGSIARNYVIHSPVQGQIQATTATLLPKDESPKFRRSLPPPELGSSEELPASTRYSSKRYKTEGTASESFLVRSSTATSDGQEHSPSPNIGQRFSLDLTGNSKQVLTKRLSSESAIVQLLKEIMDGSRSTILSYHCDQISSQHMTCVGIATQGHIILHASPQFISIDVKGVSLDQASVQAILGQTLVATSVPTMEQKDAIKTRSQKNFREATALIHPAMLTTVDPKTVVLVGGSVLSLKQMLQHMAVERLILLEMDPNWNTQGETYPRLEQHTELSAAEWFALADGDSVDAIFVESPGPSDIVPDITRVLKEHNSTLVVQTSSSTRTEQETTAIKAQWIQALSAEDDGFDTITEYDEGDANFLVAFTDDKELVGRWYANEAEIQLSIRERILPPYDYIDATSIISYQSPSRRAADAFCADNPEDDGCINGGTGFDPERSYVPISSFEVQQSTVQNAGRGVYVNEDIEEGSYVFIDTCVQNIYLTDLTIRVIDDFVDNAASTNVSMTQFDGLMGYADGYGFTAEEFGYRAYDVDPGIATFVNHGCNGTANVGSPEYRYLTELSYKDINSSESEVDDEKSYNPAMDRSRRTASCAGSLALRNMESGEEVFNNYMTFAASEDTDEYVESLRAECAGSAVGIVSQYEMAVKGPNRLLSGRQEHFELESSNLTRLNSNMTTESCLHCGIRMQEIS